MQHFTTEALQSSLGGLLTVSVCHRVYLGRIAPLPVTWAPAFRSASSLDEVAEKVGVTDPLRALSRSKANSKGKVEIAESVSASEASGVDDEPLDQRTFSLKAKKSIVLGLETSTSLNVDDLKDALGL